MEQWARRLRARFQVGLIGWIRGERLEQNLDILAAVAQKLEQIATRQPVFQLWWVTGAVIEALQDMGISVPVVRIGWPDHFIEHGKIETLRAKYGLTVDEAYTQLQPLLRSRKRPTLVAS